MADHDDFERRMAGVARVFEGVAASMQLAEEFMPGWLPARAAVREVCGVEWANLSHGKRTEIGAWLRDEFARDWQGFAMTPTRLIPKTSGKGSHQIAVYPPEWLTQKRPQLQELLGDAPPANMLPF